MADVLKGKKGRDPRCRHVRESRARGTARRRSKTRSRRRGPVSIEDGGRSGHSTTSEPANTVRQVDHTVDEVSPDDYDALLVLGGVGNPDQLRGDENAVSFVRVPRSREVDGGHLPRPVGARRVRVVRGRRSRRGRP